MFDWENAIALDTKQGNRASSRREGKVSWVYSSCGRNLGYILEKTHETFPSLRDEARFPCIVSRAIAFSQSNT